MSVNQTPNPDAFHDFERTGWESNVSEYDAAFARVTLPDERCSIGHYAIGIARNSIFSCFADCAFAFDHVGWVAEGPYTDIALRWSFTARHAHDGRYGSASGRDIYILAVTHLRTINGQIAQEWTIFDELALRRQMAGGL